MHFMQALGLDCFHLLLSPVYGRVFVPGLGLQGTVWLVRSCNGRPPDTWKPNRFIYGTYLPNVLSSRTGCSLRIKECVKNTRRIFSACRAWACPWNLLGCGEPTAPEEKGQDSVTISRQL
ncbi:hypothetical protein B0T21DRAFT_375680 [Apiosordaria backusii]|uniref:Secreted protein n=1 Tax=Apiosordaria backusii TaxID=314023 RepID=A0AA40DSA8_9PEZI|nr:hypothetical protein B0T21DRAFT_375680 [Apiosordaria backusii]